MPDLVDLEGSTRHEAALLLGSAFQQLPAATQEAVLQRIAAGPDHDGVVRWLEFIGIEPTAEKIAEHYLRRRAARFALVADHVPEAWRTQVQAILGRAGVFVGRTGSARSAAVRRAFRQAVSTFGRLHKPLARLRVVLLDSLPVGIRHPQCRFGRNVALLRGLHRRLECRVGIPFHRLAGRQVLPQQGYFVFGSTGSPFWRTALLSPRTKVYENTSPNQSIMRLGA